MTVEFTREGLERLHFDGFVPIRDLRAIPTRQWLIPATEGGLYLAFRQATGPPGFRRTNQAGTWRGDPTLPLAELRRRWVQGSPVVYIGKADLTDRGNSLRKRVSAYLRFGAGSNARHSGGYPTWQLVDSDRLLIAWRVVRPPKTPLGEERRLCAAHVDAFGALPFANSI